MSQSWWRVHVAACGGAAALCRVGRTLRNLLVRRTRGMWVRPIVVAQDGQVPSIVLGARSFVVSASRVVWSLRVVEKRLRSQDACGVHRAPPRRQRLAWQA